MHAPGPVDGALLYTVTRRVRSVDARFHREVWLPYLAGFPDAVNEPVARVGSIDALEHACEVMPTGRYALALNASEARRFIRHPNPVGCALRRASEIEIDRVRRRTLRALLASPNLSECVHLDVGEDVRAFGSDEARALVTNPHLTALEHLEFGVRLLPDAFSTLGSFAPSNRLRLSLSMPRLGDVRDVSNLFGGALGRRLREFFCWKGFGDDATLEHFLGLESLRRLEVLELPATGMNPRRVDAFVTAPMVESLRLLEVSDVARMDSARWCRFFGADVPVRVFRMEIEVSDDDPGWVDALAAWRPLADLKWLSVRVDGVPRETVLGWFRARGAEPFAHLDALMVDRTDVVGALGAR